MTYAQFVAQYGIPGKLVADLAALLDNPLFAVDPKNGHYGMAEVRQAVFDMFCRVCAGARVRVPDLETALIECHLPQRVDERSVSASVALIEALTSRVDGYDFVEATTVRAIAVILESFPNLIGYGSVDKNALVALANRNLIRLGRDPIRPEYKPLVVDYPAPPRPLKVLIVDDDLGEIFKTAASLAGWPDVEVFWIHHKESLGFEPSPDKMEPAVIALAAAIVDQHCDVVFMDQGLGGLEGNLVVAKLMEQGARMIFVANTGGDADKLMTAGCVASAKKGDETQRAMRVVFGRLA